MIFEFFVATYMYVDFFHQSKLVCHCQWWRPMFVQNIGFLAHIRPSVGAMLKIDCLTSIHSRVRVTIISVGLHHICFYCGTKLSSAVNFLNLKQLVMNMQVTWFVKLSLAYVLHWILCTMGDDLFYILNWWVFTHASYHC